MSGKDYLELVQAFQSTKGFEIHRKLQELRTTLAVFYGNQQQFLARLKFHSSDDSSCLFDGMDKKSALDMEFIELTRLLHNYVASVGALVDHTRRIAKHALCAADFREYQARVDTEFKCNPITCFLKDLRNVSLHSSNPPLSRVIRFEQGRLVSRGIEFSTKRLQRDHEWQKASITFMKSFRDGIPLSPVVAEYEGKIGAFYRWLVGFILQCRKNEMAEMWSKHDTWAKFCKSEGIPNTEEEFREYVRKELRSDPKNL